MIDRALPRLEFPRYYTMSDAGNYFVYNTATPGTGVNYKIEQSFSDTSAYVCIFNSDTGSAVTGTAKRLYLDYIMLILTAVPTNASSAESMMKIDNLNKVASGGTALTAVSPNMDVSATSKATVTLTPTLTAAGASVRQLNREKMLAAIPRLGDVFLFLFGGEFKGTSGGVINGSNPQQVPMPAPPVILGPGHSLSLHIWHPASTVAAAYEAEVGLWQF